jgi:putative transposase
MSSLHIYLHIVFGVKSRSPILESGKRVLLFNHIVSNAKANNIQIQEINGHDDHVHVLIKLTGTQSVSKIMNCIKGESSWWANQVKLFDGQLVWAKGYYARSIDPDNLSTIAKYIGSQAYKHSLKSAWLHQYLQIVSKENNLSSSG